LEALMYFREIGRNRYAVHRDKDDEQFHGTVEKHEYVSISMATGKRVTKRFWKAYGAGGGWCQTSKEQFATREDAGAFLLKEADTPYADKKMHWTKRQGESATLKAAKEGS
jgi:hypothetical protein